MSVELRVLTWSVLLGFVHVIVSSHAKSWQRGYRWTASVRDEVLPPLVGLAGRFDRALAAVGMLLFVISLLRA